MQQESDTEAKEPGTWSTTCLGLLGEPKKLLTAILLPPVAYHNASAAFEIHPAGICKSFLGGFCIIPGYRIRSRLRAERNLPGSCLSDFCKHCICHCISLARVWQEAASHEFFEFNIQRVRRASGNLGPTEPVPTSVAESVGGPSTGHESVPAPQEMHRSPPLPPGGIGGPGGPSSAGRVSLSPDMGGVSVSEDSWMPPSEFARDRSELEVGLMSGDVEREYDKKLRERVQQAEAMSKLMCMTAGVPYDAVPPVRNREDDAKELREKLEKHRPKPSSREDKSANELGEENTKHDRELQKTASDLAQAELDGNLGLTYAVGKDEFLAKRTNTALRHSLADQIDFIMSARTGNQPENFGPIDLGTSIFLEDNTPHSQQ